MTQSARLRDVAMMADYNRWANRRLYADAAGLSGEALYRNVGVYFGTLFATLEHILKVDRTWAHLLGGGTLADAPAMPPVADFAALSAVRAAEDEALAMHVAAIDEAWLDTPLEFRSTLESWRDKPYRGTRGDVLTHLFNHQTHHRGQAHTALSLLGREPSALDLLVKVMLGE